MTQKLYDAITQAGFSGEAADTMYAIVLAESRGNAWAFNPNAGTGDLSYGLAQINMIGDLGPARREEYGLSTNDDLFDPATNLRIAYAMSGHGADWTPWSTYDRGEHTQYLNSDHEAEITYVSEGGSPHTVTAAPTPPPTLPSSHPAQNSTGTGRTYTVQTGDTLSAIAAHLGLGDWHGLYAANEGIIGPDPDLIKPGQVLHVPGQAPAPHPLSHGGERLHVVEPGDTLSGIAEANGYGSDWEKIYAANRGVIGTDPNSIFPGQRLVLP